MLRGIDVSGYQPLGGGRFYSSVVETAYSGSDFVIAKATQGTRPLNSHFVAQLERALADGKLVGAYHYAEGGDPIAEADAFLACVSNYLKRAILCLDWENGDNDSWGSTSWAKRFVDRVFEKTGIRCVVYTYPAGRSQVASCASDYPLWIAGYPDSRFSWELPEMQYSTGAWDTWTIWQYSSSGGACDLNVAQLTEGGWKRLAGGDAEGFKPHWVINSYGWWYATGPSSWYYDQWADIDGETYYFDADGYAQKGWVRYGNYWCYMHEGDDPRQCAMETGFQDIGSHRYYFYPEAGSPRGTMATGLFDVDGKKYLATENGNILSGGIFVQEGNVYAIDADGVVKTDGVIEVVVDDLGRLTGLKQ